MVEVTAAWVVVVSGGSVTTTVEGTVPAEAGPPSADEHATKLAAIAISPAATTIRTAGDSRNGVAGSLRPMYAFALRPKWIVGHVIAIAAVVVFGFMASWQFSRLDEKRDRNDQIRANADLPPAAIADLEGIPTGELDWRRVRERGRYDHGGEVVIRSRSHDGVSGYHVVTPLRLDDGTALLVNRGWVPLTVGEQRPIPPASPPTGTVTVEGLLRQTQTRSGFAAADPATGRLTDMNRVDVDRIDQQLDYQVFDLYLQLEEQAPAQSDLPVIVDPPSLDEGPHLSYAVQWILFAVVVVVGYPLLLRRQAGNHSE